MCEKDFEFLYKNTRKCYSCMRIYNKYNYLKRKGISPLTD